MEFPIETETTFEKQRICSKCHETFDKPELVKYYVCPHCKSKIEEEQKKSCQHWFGYLHEKDRDEQIPPGCVECKKAVECMLNQYYQSATAVAEIKKWY